MPEILTKHPGVVMKVLKSEGAQCGTGAQPKILTKCPPDKFCTLAGGELCVFGPDELGKMTQLAPTDVCKSSIGSTSSLEYVPSAPAATDTGHTATALPFAIAVVTASIVGIVMRRR
jgi:hypothetical protein